MSQDFVGSSYTSNFDANAGIALILKFFKIISWYDNEYGYSAKLIELAVLLIINNTYYFMILIVDSGSTKTDWIAINDDGQKLFETQTLGLNPQVLSEYIYRRKNS